MVVVPAGSFEMGSPASEAGHVEDEEPQQQVTIAQPFAVSKYEVRFDEWLPCVQAGVCKALPDAGFGRGARPVINVSWDDAKRYVDWLCGENRSSPIVCSPKRNGNTRRELGRKGLGIGKRTKNPAPTRAFTRRRARRPMTFLGRASAATTVIPRRRPWECS